MDHKLKSRCGGLLEIVHTSRFDKKRLETDDGSARLNEPDFPVEYIHRTARSFLKEPSVWSGILKSSNGDQKFNPNLYLLSGSLMALKILPRISKLRTRGE